MSAAILSLPQYAFMTWCSVKENENTETTLSLPLWLPEERHIEGNTNGKLKVK
jgi:hypothetical protein